MSLQTIKRKRQTRDTLGKWGSRGLLIPLEYVLSAFLLALSVLVLLRRLDSWIGRSSIQHTRPVRQLGLRKIQSFVNRLFKLVFNPEILGVDFLSLGYRELRAFTIISDVPLFCSLS